MDKIEAIKEVKVNGNSYAVHITSELKMIGLSKGDKVKVTLEKVRN